MLGASPLLPGCSFVLCVLLAPDNHFLFPIDFTQTLLPFPSIPGMFSSSSSHQGKSINFRIPRPAFGPWALQVRAVSCFSVAFSVNPCPLPRMFLIVPARRKRFAGAGSHSCFFPDRICYLPTINSKSGNISVTAPHSDCRPLLAT